MASAGKRAAEAARTAAPPLLNSNINTEAESAHTAGRGELTSGGIFSNWTFVLAAAQETPCRYSEEMKRAWRGDI